MVLRVGSWDEAPWDAVKVVLHRCPRGIVRGWFLSPLIVTDGSFRIFCEAKSRELIAATALVKAQAISSRYALVLCIVDPDKLYDEIWG